MAIKREFFCIFLVEVVNVLNFILRGNEPCYGSWNPLGLFFLGSTCSTNHIKDKGRIKIYYFQIFNPKDKEIYSLVQSKCIHRDMDGI